MPSDRLAIRVQNLGKKYVIGGPQEKYLTFRDAIANTITAPFRRLTSPNPATEFWALRNVSFDIEPGEVVGIIGRNGAGKSTLLKILSRITSPSEGTVDLYGRVGSLLEVGTGFHPELTGRENIFLSGSILGMKKREIEDKLDEIVKFSEIEQFLDTPAKRYSSGMYVRLAFAVAAYMDTEILLVDEVLAVGDAQFQKKCMGKMGEVAKEGRTVLFVSHNMPMIVNLCPRTILIQNGQIVKDGSTRESIGLYLMEKNENPIVNDISNYSRTGGRERVISNIWAEDRHGNKTNSFFMGQEAFFFFQYNLTNPIINPGFGFGFDDSNGHRIFSLNNYMTERNPLASISRGIACCHIQKIPLCPGKFFISVAITDNERVIIDYVERAYSIQIVPDDVYNTGKIPQISHGSFFVDAQIYIQKRESS